MRLAFFGIALLLGAHHAAAQQTTPALAGPPAAEAAPSAPDAPGEKGPSPWTISFGALGYIVDDGRDYVQPTLKIDHDWLHLEARYNYEDLDTASIWVGYNFSVGEELTLDITPMIGGVFGDTRGVAPGYEVTLAWKGFELYTEGEFIFDADNSSDDFFYSWSELTYSPTDWLRFGVAAQRTKIREERSDFEVGPMVGLTFEHLDFSAYVLFADEGDPTIVLGFAIEF